MGFLCKITLCLKTGKGLKKYCIFTNQRIKLYENLQ